MKDIILGLLLGHTGTMLYLHILHRRAQERSRRNFDELTKALQSEPLFSKREKRKEMN